MTRDRVRAAHLRHGRLPFSLLKLATAWPLTGNLMIPEEHIREIERARIQALLDRDMELARRLHAPEYQLITPAGTALSRDRYLAKIASGELTYLQWKPQHMHVRLAGAMALVRYKVTLELDAGGGRGTPFECWHTDSYELNDGAWQAVWSQATAIRSQ